MTFLPPLELLLFQNYHLLCIKILTCSEGVWSPSDFKPVKIDAGGNKVPTLVAEHPRPPLKSEPQPENTVKCLFVNKSIAVPFIVDPLVG